MSSSAVVTTGSSSSSSCTFNNNRHSIKKLIQSHHQIFPISPSFQGLSLIEAKRGVANSFIKNDNNNKKSNVVGSRRGLNVTARTAGAAKSIEVEVDKPLGLTLGGNAAKAGLKAGDQVLYTSSFFGDELWPADKLGFTKTAIQAKPDSVYFVVNRGGADVDVKRLPKRPAPPRFGRKLTETQKARATHICLDCGFIYTLQKPFEEQADGYVCPQCRAPKKRFARYDVNTGKAIGGGLPPIGVIIGLLVGVGGVAALLLYGLQ
ncbi:hypothetical protein F8388_024531 [Cannabis sativa]|uniref:Rubredoxin-like domain-containing protein n=1 Tax=Cannabis sativa TaxID=3483 RepID=A0A7J6GBP9_CANSA|nr:hypothetical protein F8388_024531 [Cannabis sativa]